jgi:hypothetical protein
MFCVLFSQIKITFFFYSNLTQFCGALQILNLLVNIFQDILLEIITLYYYKKIFFSSCSLLLQVILLLEEKSILQNFSLLVLILFQPFKRFCAQLPLQKYIKKAILIIQNIYLNLSLYEMKQVRRNSNRHVIYLISRRKIIQ